MVRLRDTISGVKCREYYMSGNRRNIEDWPISILRILFASDFEHYNRLSLALHMSTHFGNEEIAILTYKHYNRHWQKWTVNDQHSKFFIFRKMIEKMLKASSSSDSGTYSGVPIPKKLLYCVEPTAREIQLKICLLLINKTDKDTKNIMKDRIADLFFELSQWPVYILRILLGREEFDYSNRLAMAAFFHGNGLRNKNEAEDIFCFYNRSVDSTRKWKQRIYHFRSIFDYLDKALNPNDFQHEEIRSKYNFYSLIERRFVYYDGCTRSMNGAKSNRIF